MGKRANKHFEKKLKVDYFRQRDRLTPRQNTDIENMRGSNDEN